MKRTNKKFMTAERSRNRYNRVHAIEDEDVSTNDEYEEVYESDSERQYPKSRAPPVEELVGAINC